MKACETDECKNCGDGESSCSRFDVFLILQKNWLFRLQYLGDVLLSSNVTSNIMLSGLYCTFGF